MTKYLAVAAFCFITGWAASIAWQKFTTTCWANDRETISCDVYLKLANR